MAEDTIEVGILRADEVAQVNDLFNSAYHAGRNATKFAWEFNNAPAGAAIYVVARDAATKQVIGTQCAIPINLVDSEGNVYRTAKSEDTLLNPAYRGKKVFDRMYALLFEECRKNGILYIWGFTSAQKPFLKIGFDIPYSHSQSLWVKGIGPSYTYLASLNTQNTVASKLKILGLCLAAKTKAIVSSSALLKNYTVEVLGKDAVIDNQQLINQQFAPGSGLYAINQNPGFLAWRIKDNPYHGKLYNITFSNATGLAAHIIINYHKNGVWYLTTDIYAHTVSAAERTAMLRQAIAEVCKREDNVALIRTWDFTHNAYNMAEVQARSKAGFVHLNRGIQFVWKNLDPANTLKADDFVLSRIASQGMV